MSKWRWGCDKCGNPKEYHALYDAFFCAKCNEWRESRCEDPNCEFCPKRPEKPINSEKNLT